MGKFVYVSRILPGKAEAVRAHNRTKKTILKDPEVERAHQQFWDRIGMSGWNCWLQHLAGDDYHIHYLEGESLPRIFQSLRELIREGNPVALGLRNYYLDVLGKDYLDPAVEPKLELLIDVQTGSADGVVCRRGHSLPLRAESVGAHREYTLGLNASHIAKALQPWGYARMTKWLQQTPEGEYLVYHEECTVPFVEHRKLFLKALHSPDLRPNLNTLADHTGLTCQDLWPNLEFLRTEV